MRESTSLRRKCAIVSAYIPNAIQKRKLDAICFHPIRLLTKLCVEKKMKANGRTCAKHNEPYSPTPLQRGALMSKFKKILFPYEETLSKPVIVGHFLLLMFLMQYTIPFFTVPLIDLGFQNYFIHYINLIFHEAGHMIFGLPGKRLLTVFGGSLMQVLVPAVLARAFYLKNKNPFAAGLGLWWTGQSLVDCAPYINDARMLQLPLLGGGTGREVEGHDWEYILTELNLLESDIYIARTVLIIGRLIMLAGLLWSTTSLLYEMQQLRKPAIQNELV